MSATVGAVNGQRVALLKNAVVTDVATHASVADKQELYRQVAQGLAEDESGVFDVGFKLVAAAAAGIERGVIQLALNCTFGQTPTQYPSASGRLWNVRMGPHASCGPGGRNLHPNRCNRPRNGGPYLA